MMGLFEYLRLPEDRAIIFAALHDRDELLAQLELPLPEEQLSFPFWGLE